MLRYLIWLFCFVYKSHGENLEMNNANPLKKFLQFLLPSMMTMIMLAVYTFADTFVVGQRLGSVALGAMGVCTPVLTVTYAFGFLFGMGGASHYALLKGSGDQNTAGEFFTTSVMLLLLCGTAAAILLNIFAEPFALFLGATRENMTYVMPYLRVLLCYIPGFMMDVLMMSFMKNEGHPTIAMIATITGSGLNVILDFVFVFAFDWGMFGAAFATALCSGIGLMINICCALFGHMNIRLKKIKMRSDVIRKILSNGFSILILEASSGIVTFVFIHQAALLYGRTGSSIYTIIMNWSLIFVNLTIGIAQAMQPLVSYSCGAGDTANMKRYMRYALISATVLGLIDSMVCLIFAGPLSGVFTSDSREVINMAAEALRMYQPAFLFMAPGICIGYYFQAAAKAGYASITMLSRGIVLPVLFVLVLPLVFGKTGLWISVPLTELFTSGIAVFLLLHSYTERKTQNAVDYREKS